MVAKKQTALSALLTLVRKVAYSPRSGLGPAISHALKRHLAAVEAERKPAPKGPSTLYDRVLEDPFKG